MGSLGGGIGCCPKDSVGESFSGIGAAEDTGLLARVVGAAGGGVLAIGRRGGPFNSKLAAWDS